jgi:uncharacterized protein
VIDGLKFAREGERLQGNLPLSRLPRVAAELPDPAGSGVSYELKGFVDSRGKPGIDVQIRAQFALVCQRCLSRLDFDLDRHTRFMLVADEAALPELGEEDTETEAVPIEAVANVVDLVEQEVLLDLPIAPSHPDGACAAPDRPHSVEPDSPFAVLRRLKDSENVD